MAAAAECSSYTGEVTERRGIPAASFVQDVQSYLSQSGLDVNSALAFLQERLQQYRVVEMKLLAQQRDLQELAMGLELSKQKFIWLLNDPDNTDIYIGANLNREFEFHAGFEERLNGVGLLVRDWAPQTEILAHSSIGGFLCACDWASCVETITMGVPIIAWPTHSDHPKNSFLLTELLKIGLVITEWNKKRDEMVTASTIDNVVRKLMASEEGDEIRKRAKEFGEAVRKSTEKGGVSQMELDYFIAHITR